MIPDYSSLKYEVNFSGIITETIEKSKSVIKPSLNHLIDAMVRCALVSCSILGCEELINLPKESY